MKATILTSLFMMILSASFGQDAKQYYTQGVEKAQSGALGEAIELFSKAIELQPEDPYAWYNRGIAKSMLKLYEDALADFEQTVKLAPDYKKAYLNRGIAKRHLTDYDGAASDYSYAIKLDEKYPEAWYNRGLLYDLLGKTDLACADFSKAKELGLKNAQKKTARCDDSGKKSETFNNILRLTKTAKNEQYGFTEKNPVKVGTGTEGGPANQRAYLELLRDAQGKPVRYERTGSCCDYKSENGLFGIAKLDQYEITYRNEKGEEKKASVYMSFYDYEAPQILFGFKTVGGK